MQLALLTLRWAISAVALIGGMAPQGGISWQSCLLGDDDSTPNAQIAECASVRLPLRYHSGQDSITIAAMRILGEEATAQLWFLDGGPGDAATASLRRLAGVLDMPDVDLYTIDHRGVGGSAVLLCPDQQSNESVERREIVREEWAACINHIVESRSDLDALTASNSAIDISRMIEMTREPGKRVVIMGVSYGTYLAQRYLQMFAEQPDAVILDGIVPPDWSFAEFDTGLDITARRVLGLCTDNIECANRLGPDPVHTTSALLDALNTGHCGGIGLTPQLTRLVLGSMLMVDAVPHAFLAGLIHRVRRCAWHDRLAVLHMFREVFGDLSEPPSHSQVLQRHVSMSELWPEDAMDPSVFAAALEGYIMTTEVSASFAGTASSWPVYQRPPNGQELVSYERPMLMLHGGLDPTMPIERLDSLRAHYDGMSQTFVGMPNAGHVVINESACAVAIYRDFIRNPARRPQTDCMLTLPAVAMIGDAQHAKEIFGTEDFWGDSVGVFDWILFVSIFRFPAFVIAIAVLLRGLLRRPKMELTFSTPGWVKTSLIVAGWMIISAIVWFGVFAAPLLMNYGRAVLSAIGMVVFHLLVGAFVVKRLARSPKAA